MNRKKLYIAYGSNLNLQQMAHRCPTARLVGTGILQDYALQFKGMSHHAFATIAPQKGNQVPVGIWAITPRDEQALDMYEGYPTHYYKQDISVELDGKTHSAMVYIMNLEAEFGLPSKRYYDTVYKGYLQCGLDVAVLEQAYADSVVVFEAQEEAEFDDDFSEGFDEEDKQDESFGNSQLQF